MSNGPYIAVRFPAKNVFKGDNIPRMTNTTTNNNAQILALEFGELIIGGCRVSVA